MNLLSKQVNKRRDKAKSISAEVKKIILPLVLTNIFIYQVFDILSARTLKTKTKALRKTDDSFRGCLSRKETEKQGRMLRYSLQLLSG
jgi:hypothetical protein